MTRSLYIAEIYNVYLAVLLLPDLTSVAGNIHLVVEIGISVGGDRQGCKFE